MLIINIILLIVNCLCAKTIWGCAYNKGRQDQALRETGKDYLKEQGDWMNAQLGPFKETGNDRV